MNKAQYEKSSYKNDVEDIVRSLDAMRSDRDKPLDVNLADYVQKRYGVSLGAFYEDLGIDPTMDTIQNLITLPDPSVRFLYPEIIRDAIRLGLRRSAIWPNIVAAEQTVPNPTITQPWINMSDATPKVVGEAETISTGTISYGQKTLKLTKMGKGVKISYELKQYVSLNIISLFLQDMGIKLSHGLDALMIDCLINGEQANGSESAPVIGVATANTLVYRDLLKIWIRMRRIGRTPDAIIGGEEMALDTLDLAEFKDRKAGTTDAKLTLKTPVPSQTDYWIHGNVPDDQQILIDTSSALIKYNAQPLMVESEKIVSNQTEASYATLTTGYGIIYRDARVVMDQSDTIVNLPFPSYMDVDALENVVID
jgi:hypothetical protein